MRGSRRGAPDETSIRSRLLPFLVEHGAPDDLDDPVLDYSTQVILAAASDEGNDDAFEAAADVLKAVTGAGVDSGALEGFFFRARKRFEAIPNGISSYHQTEEGSIGTEDVTQGLCSPGLNPNACEFKPKVSNGTTEVKGCWTKMQLALEEASYRSEDTNDSPQSSGFFAEGMNEEEVLAMLSVEFPTFDEESLWSILDANDFDISKCVDVLTQLEMEDEGACLSVPTAVAPALNDRNFPSLGKGVGSAHQGTDQVTGGGHNFVDAAKLGASVQRTSAQPNSQTGPSRTSTAPSRRAVAPVPWLETGEAVTSLYADSREDAREHARLRNAYFQQATQAYIAGNGMLAKNLSAKGRWHNEQMKNAHAEASTNIYKQRNLQANSANRSGLRLIDLHGLHVAEALGILQAELKKLRATRTSEDVQIVVGTGHHTKGSRTPARLPSAVKDFLEGEGLPFRIPQPGLIHVTLA